MHFSYLLIFEFVAFRIRIAFWHEKARKISSLYDMGIMSLTYY